MKPNKNCLVELVLAGSPTRASAECQLAAMALGIIDAIRKRKISATEATDVLFTLDNYMALRRHRLNPDLLELFQWGMELEDVEELVPEGIEESLQGIEKIGNRLMESPRRRIAKLAPTGTG